jgi:hypothetical protein
MPLALAWFLGSVFMLAGLAGAWIVRTTNQSNASSKNGRVEIEGVITRYDDQGSSDDWGRLGCTIEYSIERQRYRISTEFNPDFYPVGQRIALMVLSSTPSDALVLEELARRSFRWPIGLLLFGAALLAWGYAEEFSL